MPSISAKLLSQRQRLAGAASVDLSAARTEKSASGTCMIQIPIGFTLFELARNQGASLFVFPF